MSWMLLLLMISILTTQCCSNSVLNPSLRSQESEKAKKCIYSRPHGMFGVDCSDLRLSDIPSTLRTSIEVLDLTYNRIRELYNDSFENYPYLRILYLTDNSISYIEAGAFAPLQDLEILDLTLNSLHFVPEALETLPSLRQLRMGRNQFLDVTFSKTLPSIKYLSLSFCRLKKFPDFTALPGLEQLNISGNSLQTINLTQVAPMCSLKLLDITKNPRLFRQEHCNCQLLAKWFRNLSMEGLRVLPELSDFCKNITEGREIIDDSVMCFTNATNSVFEKGISIRQSCEAEVLRYGSGPLRLKDSTQWILIVLVSLAFIIVCAFCMYYIRKKQVKHRNHEVEPLPQVKNRS